MHMITFSHETTGEGNPVPWGQMQHQFYWPGQTDSCNGAGQTQSDTIVRRVDPPSEPASGPGTESAEPTVV